MRRCAPRPSTGARGATGCITCSMPAPGCRCAPGRRRGSSPTTAMRADAARDRPVLRRRRRELARRWGAQWVRMRRTGVWNGRAAAPPSCSLGRLACLRARPGWRDTSGLWTRPFDRREHRVIARRGPLAACPRYLGRLSMYRLVLIALGVLAVIALRAVVLRAGRLPTPLELVVTFARARGRHLRRECAGAARPPLPWRIESSSITAADPAVRAAAGARARSELLGLALAGAVASLVEVPDRLAGPAHPQPRGLRRRSAHDPRLFGASMVRSVVVGRHAGARRPRALLGLAVLVAHREGARSCDLPRRRRRGRTCCVSPCSRRRSTFAFDAGRRCVRAVVVAVPVPRRVHAVGAADPAAASVAAVHGRRASSACSRAGRSRVG